MTERELYERYVERAAIMQYEGGMSREASSQHVFNSVGRWCKEKRLPFPKLVRDDFRVVITGKVPS